MNAIVQWVLARFYRPALVALACAPLPLIGPFVTTALLVLATAHYGLRFGLGTTAAGGLALTGLVAVTGSDLVLLAGGGTFSMLLGAAIGGLLRWARSLSLTYQSILLFCLLATAGVSVAGPAPETMFGPIIETLVGLVDEDSPEQAQAIRDAAPMMLGVTAAAVFAELVVALIVGYWALSYARADVALGESFRALKLGRILGIFGMVWLTLGLFVPLALIRDLAPLALMGFLFQGLAVMHAWAHGKQWHPGLIAPVYVLLVPPLTGITVTGLSAVGLLDNVFDLRAPLKA